MLATISSLNTFDQDNCEDLAGNKKRVDHLQSNGCKVISRKRHFSSNVQLSTGKEEENISKEDSNAIELKSIPSPKRVKPDYIDSESSEDEHEKEKKTENVEIDSQTPEKTKESKRFRCEFIDMECQTTSDEEEDEESEDEDSERFDLSEEE